MKFTPWNDATIEILKENWGKIPRRELGKMCGTTERGVAKKAKKIGLPNIHAMPERFATSQKDAWTAEEDKILLDNITLSYDMIAAMTVGRTRAGACARYAELRRLDPTLPPKPHAKPIIKPWTDVPWDNSWSHPAYVTYEDAVTWMRQALRGWKPSADQGQDMREINAQRRGGSIPLPPFKLIPSRAGWDAPNWDAGNNAASEYAK